MKRISIISLFLASLLIWSCEKEDNKFGEVTEPDGLEVLALVVGADDANPGGDGSGLVNFTATADNAITYKYVFSDGTSEIAPTGELVKRFTQVGVNTYTVTVIASGTAGVSTSVTTEVTVRSDFDDAEAVQLLTGGSSKTWYWAADEPGHLGVG